MPVLRRFPVFRASHLIADSALSAVAYLLAFLIRFDRVIPPSHIHQLWLFLPVIVALRLATNAVFGLYQHLWRYFSVKDMIGVLQAVTTASCLFVAVAYLTGNGSFPRTVFAADWLLAVLLLGGVRFAKRFWQESRQVSYQSLKRTLVVGAGDAGEALIREMQRKPQNGLQPVALVDDDPAKHGIRLHGLKVYGGRDAIPQVVDDLEIDLIAIAMPSAPAAAIRDVVDIAAGTPATVQIIPSLSEIVSGSVTITHLRHVQIEDLLGRAEVHIEDDALAALLRDRTVMVTGAGGSIGSELCRQIGRYRPARLIVSGHGENSVYDIQRDLADSFPELVVHAVIADVRDERRLDGVFATHRPDLVFHAAAHKHVPLMETNLTDAVTNNVIGTWTLARVAARHGVSRFVLISTDKAVEPTSHMGMTKRLAELVVLGLGQAQGEAPATRFMAVRFGNVIGSRGSAIPLFQEQIARGGPVTVTDPRMTRFFMTIPEAAQLVVQAGSLGEGGEIFLLDMGSAVRIVDLVRNLIRLSGLNEADIPIVYTGMRPGEKLHEALSRDDEVVRPSKHSKIAALAPSLPPLAPFLAEVTQLADAVYGLDEAALKAKVLDLLRYGEPAPVVGQPTEQTTVDPAR
jgi:FlaA1/EpsC-like NDP-sugar epimerase